MVDRRSISCPCFPTPTAIDSPLFIRLNGGGGGRRRKWAWRYSPRGDRRAGPPLHKLRRRKAARPATFGIFETCLDRPFPEDKHHKHHDVEDWDKGGQHIPPGISGLRNDLYLADEAEDEHQEKEHAEDGKEH